MMRAPDAYILGALRAPGAGIVGVLRRLYRSTAHCPGVVWQCDCWALAERLLPAFYTLPSGNTQRVCSEAVFCNAQPPPLYDTWVTAGRIMLTTLCTQGNGFTCGIDDVILNPEAEAKRAEVLTGADAVALRASAEAAGLPSLKVSLAVPFCSPHRW